MIFKPSGCLLRSLKRRSNNLIGLFIICMFPKLTPYLSKSLNVVGLQIYMYEFYIFFISYQKAISSSTTLQQKICL